MPKLLRSHFSRLWRSKVFWVVGICMVLMSVFALINQYRFSTQYGFETKLDNFVFGYALIIAILMSVFCSLFLGTEYSDGTIRNKLIVGHSRVLIYLSAYIITLSAALIISACYLLVVFVLGIPLFGLLTTPVSQFVLYFLVTLLMIAAVCGVLTAICMLIPSKAIAAIVSILLMIVLLVVAMNIENALSEPEIYTDYMMYVDGELVEGEPHPNPYYPRGVKRVIYEICLDALPSGQAIQLARYEAPHPFKMMLCSLVLTVLSTGIGVLVFRRKDMK